MALSLRPWAAKGWRLVVFKSPRGDVHTVYAFACAVPGRCGGKGQGVLHECRGYPVAISQTVQLSHKIFGIAEFKSKKIRIPPADVGTSVLTNRSLQSQFQLLLKDPAYLLVSEANCLQQRLGRAGETKVQADPRRW